MKSIVLSICLLASTAFAQTVTLAWDWPDDPAPYTFDVFATTNAADAMPWPCVASVAGQTRVDVPTSPVAGGARFYYVVASRPSSDTDLWDSSYPSSVVSQHWIAQVPTRIYRVQSEIPKSAKPKKLQSPKMK